jgi:hypothetical protein
MQVMYTYTTETRSNALAGMRGISTETVWTNSALSNNRGLSSNALAGMRGISTMEELPTPNAEEQRSNALAGMRGISTRLLLVLPATMSRWHNS